MHISRLPSAPCATAESSRVVVLPDHRGSRSWCLLPRRHATRESCYTMTGCYLLMSARHATVHSYDRVITNLRQAILLPRRCGCQHQRVGSHVFRFLSYLTPQGVAGTCIHPEDINHYDVPRRIYKACRHNATHSTNLYLKRCDRRSLSPPLVSFLPGHI